MSGNSSGASETEARALREQMEAQAAAIDRQIADLEALSAALLLSPGNHDAELGAILQAVRRLTDHKFLLTAAYLQNVARLHDIDALMESLKTISEEMKAEAARMEDVTAAVKTADGLIGKGKKAIDALKKAAEKVPA